MKLQSNQPLATFPNSKKTLTVATNWNVKIFHVVMLASIPFPYFEEFSGKKLCVLSATLDVLVCLALREVSWVFH